MIDILIFILIAFALWKGFRDGVVVQLCGLVGIVIGIWLAYRYCGELGAWLNIGGKAANIAGFIIILIAAIITVGLIGWLLGKIFDIVGLGLFNKIGGMLLSLVKMVIILSVIFVAFSAMNDKIKLVDKSHLDRSQLYNPIKSVSKHIFPYLDFVKEKLTGDE